MSDELERHRSFVQALATPDGYEAVALCPHINGYFDKDTSLTESGLISAECQECGWVSATAPHAKVQKCVGLVSLLLRYHPRRWIGWITP